MVDKRYDLIVLTKITKSIECYIYDHTRHYYECVLFETLGESVDISEYSVYDDNGYLGIYYGDIPIILNDYIVTFDGESGVHEVESVSILCDLEGDTSMTDFVSYEYNIGNDFKISHTNENLDFIIGL